MLDLSIFDNSKINFIPFDKDNDPKYPIFNFFLFVIRNFTFNDDPDGNTIISFLTLYFSTIFDDS